MKLELYVNGEIVYIKETNEPIDHVHFRLKIDDETDYAFVSWEG